MAGDRLNQYFLDCRTNNEKGIRVSNYATDYIYQGKCFSASQRIAVTAAANMLILFNMKPAYAAGKQVSVYTPVLDTTTGPLLLDYYIGSDYSGGTSFRINNRASYGPKNLCTLTYSATGSDKGTRFTDGFVAAGHKSSGSSQEGLEFVPVQNTNILVEIDNTNGTDATVFINFVWFEV